MPVEKQIPSLCKPFLFSEEIPEEFLDETDRGCCSYRNIFDISQLQYRLVQVNRRSNKKSFAINFFQLCHLKAQQRYPLQEEVKISKRELTSLADILHDLLKTFHHAPKLYIFHYQSPKLRLDLQSQQTNSLFITITISLNIQIDKFIYRSDLE